MTLPCKIRTSHVASLRWHNLDGAIWMAPAALRHLHAVDCIHGAIDMAQHAWRNTYLAHAPWCNLHGAMQLMQRRAYHVQRTVHMAPEEGRRNQTRH